MKTIKKAINSFWFGSALFGAAGVVLWVSGMPWFAGVCFGAGGSKFITAVKQVWTGENKTKKS